MTKRLSPDDVARFEKDGYLFPIDVLSETEVADYRFRFDELTITLKNDPARDDYLFYKTNLVLPWVDEFTHNSVLLDVIEDLVGSHILLWSCCFLIKEPRTMSRFTWHQDNLHWYLEPPQAVSAWIALSHSNAQNGCVRFIPGSHKLGPLPHAYAPADDLINTTGQYIDWALPEETAVDAFLKPGQMSVHHDLTAHASGANRSDEQRIGCVIVFLPTHVRNPSLRESAMLVRGADEYDYFDLEPRPQGELDPAAIAAHYAALRKMGTYKMESELNIAAANLP